MRITLGLLGHKAHDIELAAAYAILATYCSEAGNFGRKGVSYQPENTVTRGGVDPRPQTMAQDVKAAWGTIFRISAACN